MPDSPDDDCDSRVASVGSQRATNTNNNNNNGSSASTSRRSSSDRSQSILKKKNNKNGKGRKKEKSAKGRDARDFVPQGGTFSATPLMEVDEDITSSSGSDSTSSGDDGPHSGKPNPLVDESKNNNSCSNSNDNDVHGSRKNLSRKEKALLRRHKHMDRFDAMNGKYWRTRSASESSANGESGVDGKNDMEEGEVDTSQTHASDKSDSDSESSDDSEEAWEGDDSIMLNVDSHDRNGRVPVDDDRRERESRFVLEQQKLLNGNPSADVQKAQSKEGALFSSSQKYATAPTTLADLDRKDLENQAKYIYYYREIRDIDFNLPVTCTECLQEGHLAEVCPSKECVHCGTWNKHESNFCPSWRRCQRCRERGHDEQQCPSPLKSSASEVPCDLCGSANHLELDCDSMWKLPRRSNSPGPVLVSISCAHCTSNRHLVGDCPSFPASMDSSSFTLKGIDPNMVTNTNSVVPERRNGSRTAGRGRGQRNLKIRGHADFRSPTPDSDDDMLARPERRPPIDRNPNARRNIRIGSGIGRNNRDLAGPGPDNFRRPAYDSQPSYRDRQDYFGANTRQRSLSPDPRPARMRGKDSWQPAFYPPPSQGRLRSPPPTRGSTSRGHRRGSARGGRNKRSESGDTYRPPRSYAKKT